MLSPETHGLSNKTSLTPYKDEGDYKIVQVKYHSVLEREIDYN